MYDKIFIDDFLYNEEVTEVTSETSEETTEIASLTDATMMSPMFAYLLVEPPITRMQSNSFAPVLSATLSLVSCCTMLVTSL